MKKFFSFKKIKDFFSFKTMINKTLIKILYIVGLFGVTVIGLLKMNEQIGIGLLTLILGNLVWRGVCENMIVLFSIRENLVSIENSINDKEEINN